MGRKLASFALRATKKNKTPKLYVLGVFIRKFVRY